jgi:hypothetical protein
MRSTHRGAIVGSIWFRTLPGGLWRLLPELRRAGWPAINLFMAPAINLFMTREKIESLGSI